MRHGHHEHTGGSGRGGGRGRHTDDGGQRHRRHGGPGRPGRFFEHGDLRLVALHLIAEKPRHGYEIIKDIEEKSGGAYTPSAGAIYPTLTLLQELGQLTVADGPDGRKLHTITPEGEAALAANRKTIEAVLARIAQAGASKQDASPLVRDAWLKLKHRLRLRLSGAPLDEAQVAALVAGLDAAGDSIEAL